MTKFIGLLTVLLVGLLSVETAAGEAEDALMAADVAFSDLSADQGAGQAFALYFEADGILYGTEAGNPVAGTRAILDAFSSSPPGAALTWLPDMAIVSADGTLGVTSGPYQSVYPLKDGTTGTTTGRYMTIWRQDSDGGWKVAADIGNITRQER